MKELWRRTVELIQRYPVLWLPVLWAALLSYGWSQLRVIILHDVIPRFLQQQTVLGGFVPNVSPEKTRTVFLIAGATTTLCRYADVCCYVIALLLTAKMLGRLTSVDERENPYADISIASHRRGVLLISLLACVLAAASAAFLAYPLAYYAVSVNHMLMPMQPYALAIEVFILLAIFAYFVTPTALRLLSQPSKSAIGAEEIAKGRKCSLLAAGAIAVLSMIQLSVPRPYFKGLPVSAAFGILITVIPALPYASLFIALSLLAAERKERANADDIQHAMGCSNSSLPLDGVSACPETRI